MVLGKDLLAVFMWVELELNELLFQVVWWLLAKGPISSYSRCPRRNWQELAERISRDVISGWPGRGVERGRQVPDLLDQAPQLFIYVSIFFL